MRFFALWVELGVVPVQRARVLNVRYRARLVEEGTSCIADLIGISAAAREAEQAAAGRIGSGNRAPNNTGGGGSHRRNPARIMRLSPPRGLSVAAWYVENESAPSWPRRSYFGC